MDTGSVKTADDVQKELGEISSEMWVLSPIDKSIFTEWFTDWFSPLSRKLGIEKTSLQNDREQQINRMRRQEDELNALQRQEIGLRHKVEEQKALQEKVVTMTKELKEATTKAEVSKQNRFLSFCYFVENEYWNSYRNIYLPTSN